MAVGKKNGIQIYNKFKNEYPYINISHNKICEILSNLRRCIAHYYRDVYKIE